MDSLNNANNAYTILINDDNTMTTTQKKRVMQRSKLVDTLWFLTSPLYNGFDMSKFTVSLEYVLPISRKYRNETLTLSNADYNGYLKYILPIDTKLTDEAGDIEMSISFLLVDLDSSGKPIQYVRKVSSSTITITPATAWSDIIPDEALSAIDQRIIKTDAQIRALADISASIYYEKADSIIYDKETSTLQLTSAGSCIGDKVVLPNVYDGLKDGIPSVDLNKVNQDDIDASSAEFNVVQF